MWPADDTLELSDTLLLLRSKQLEIHKGKLPKRQQLTLGGFRVIYLPSPVLKNREGCRLARAVDPGLTVVGKGDRALGLPPQHPLDLFRTQELTCRPRRRADHVSKKLI